MLRKNYVSTLMVLSMAVSLLSGCSNTVEITDNSEIIEQTEEPDVVFDDTSNLLNRTISLVDNIYNQENSKNVMVSGLSMDYAMSMALNGTNEKSSKEIESFLGMTKEEANKKYSKLLDSYKNSKDSNKLIISNAFWIKESHDILIKDEYKSSMKDIYKANVETVGMNSEGLERINGWVSDSTEGFIKKALNLEDIANANSILMNTIYFDGKWDIPFDAGLTIEDDFTLFDGSTQKVQMMSSQEYYYFENDKAVAFAKDYEDNRYQFIGILPKEEGEFSISSLNIEELLESKKSTNEINADLYIKLPKIDFEEKFKFSDILKSMGVQEVFDTSKHNFTGIYKDNFDQVSYIKEVIQNVKLKVDEKGTKAAAVTSIIISNDAIAFEPKDIINIDLNRPFVAIIMDTETNTPLFIAKIINFD